MITVYLLPIIIHFWLSNHFKIFRKCSRMVILLIFAKKRFFVFFRKISNNFLRKLDEKPKLHGYILPRQLSSWWSPARCTGCLKIWIQTFTSYNTKRLSYLRSMCCKIIITIRVNKEIKNLGMKCNKRIMKQAWPNQFRHI